MIAIKISNNSELLFTDTDSSMYELKTKDVCEDSSNDKEMFDFSNYWTKSKYYANLNKSVVGKMKLKQQVLQLENLSD